jgi:hypothetical protein
MRAHHLNESISVNFGPFRLKVVSNERGDDGVSLSLLNDLKLSRIGRALGLRTCLSTIELVYRCVCEYITSNDPISVNCGPLDLKLGLNES